MLALYKLAIDTWHSGIYEFISSQQKCSTSQIIKNVERRTHLHPLY